jgi:hypothetical protein
VEVLDLSTQGSYPFGFGRVVKDFLFLENFLAEVDALVADVDTGTCDQPADLRFSLAAKRAAGRASSLFHGA